MPPGPDRQASEGDAHDTRRGQAHPRDEIGPDLVSGPEGIAWPASTSASRPWVQMIRAGTRADRTLSSIEVSLPPKIADLPVTVGGALGELMETALREIVSLDQGHGGDLESLGTMLLRTESVASSKIERVHADIDDYARALHGSKTNASARSMVAATRALGSMIDAVGRSGVIDMATIERAHHALMADDPDEQDQAGHIREVQNWIGGSDHSPRGALYVPPPPETVDAYMADLIAFVNRSDMPAVAQAAIAHAQFESIHPFTDGNGRVGRAMVNTILRRRGATSHVVVPIASSLVANRDRYFATLDAYRNGDPTPIVSAFARAATIAASESRASAARLARAPGELRQMVGPVRCGSATEKLIALLPSTPVLTADDAIDATGSAPSSVYASIERLTAAGVLRSLTDRKRDQVWGATVILDELEDLGQRIEASSR